MSGYVILIDLCDAVQEYDGSIALLYFKSTSSLILVNYLSSVFPPKARKN
jgi:hypothetical protein